MSDTLVNLSSYIPDAAIDIRYATANNVLGQKLYENSKPLILLEVAEALNRVFKDLQAQGFKLVIWDAYRPMNAQEQLRQFCSDDRYVAKHSNHSKGIAIDLTLADKLTGQKVDMGTDFDDFSENA